jgi:1-acyl-sn-glycerol-3-phosphate acyltransferase
MSNSASLLITCSLVGVLSALACWALFTWRRTKYTFPQACLYLVNTCATRVLWRTHITGALPVGRGEGAVIVSNHRSGIDPLLIQLATDRVVHWLVAREYVEHPAMGWAFRILQSIPVNRGGVDTASTRLAMRLAQAGGLVGLFPEGRINLTDQLLLPGRPGAALIALKARVPVIPCFVAGSPYDGSALGSFLMPAKARVIVGKQIDLSEFFGREGEKDVLQEITKRFLKEIARLAGDEHFEPRLAGKQWKSEALQENAGSTN